MQNDLILFSSILDNTNDAEKSTIDHFDQYLNKTISEGI